VNRRTPTPGDSFGREAVVWWSPVGAVAVDDQQERSTAVLLFDVAVGKTPGDLLRARLDPR
jgi:hypothetical protein